MLHVGLDLSRKRLDVCLLSEQGELVGESAVPSGHDGVVAGVDLAGLAHTDHHAVLGRDGAVLVMACDPSRLLTRDAPGLASPRPKLATCV